MRRTFLVAALVPLLMTSGVRGATADPMRVELTVSAPSGCSERDDLARQIDEILGRGAIVGSLAEPTPKISVSITRDAETASFRSILTLKGASGQLVGTREIVRQGGSCDVLDGPLALVAALLVDTAESTVRLTLPPPPEPVAPPPGPPWRVETGAGLSALFGLVPPAPGLRVETRVDPPKMFPLLVRLEEFPRAQTSRDGPNGQFSVTAVTIGACPELRRSRVRLSGCLGFAPGYIHAAGENVLVQGTASSPMAMFLAEGGASLRIVGPISLGGSLGLGAGWWPANWHVTGTTGGEKDVWTPSPVALTMSVGIFVDAATEKVQGPGH
jgi:hypothetical protein